jgi:hypothetical protein
MKYTERRLHSDAVRNKTKLMLIVIQRYNSNTVKSKTQVLFSIGL